jgi:hypothetical protein
MNHRQPGASSIAALPTLLSAVALAVALAALLGPRAQPASASSLVAQIGPAAALGGGFSYQGSLSQSGRPVSGADACDMRFSLWDAASAGTQVGGSQTLAGVDFDRGLFAVTVNEGGQFGASAFAGEARWLQVEAACPASGAFTSLGRQAISAVPYATHSGSTAALQGRPVGAAAPAPGQLLGWDGSAWAPAAPAISGYEIVYSETAFDSRSVKAVRASCPSGKEVLGGGAGVFSVLSDPNWESAPVVLKQSQPDRPPFAGWFARATEVGPYGFEWIVWAYAICADVAP